MKNHSGYIRLLKAIEGTNSRMAGRAAVVINQALTLRNWLIGSHIVEYEQHGFDRARYGDRLLDRLSKDLKKKGVRGLDVRALRDCRLFFRVYPQIRGSVTPELVVPPQLSRIRGSVTPEFKRSMASGLLTPPSSSRKILERVPPPLNPDAVFRFSWTHILEFIRIEDVWKRAFYENEFLFKLVQEPYDGGRGQPACGHYSL
jgi:hypothetical protein